MDLGEAVRHGICDLIQQGLELLRRIQRGVLRPVDKDGLLPHRETVGHVDDIAVFHVQGPADVIAAVLQVELDAGAQDRVGGRAVLLDLGAFHGLALLRGDRLHLIGVQQRQEFLPAGVTVRLLVDKERGRHVVVIFVSKLCRRRQVDHAVGLGIRDPVLDIERKEQMIGNAVGLIEAFCLLAVIDLGLVGRRGVLNGPVGSKPPCQQRQEQAAQDPAQKQCLPPETGRLCGGLLREDRLAVGTEGRPFRQLSPAMDALCHGSSFPLR